jgi:ABC-type phosphate transport system substrate-binding protein
LRIFRSLVAVGAVAATATAVAMAPAMADPVNSKLKAVTPAPYDIVGVGAGTTQYLLDQFSVDYNKDVASKKTHSPTNPDFYSWDATPPSNPLDETQQISLKKGCAKQTRPDGSSAGITALSTEGKVTYKGKSYPCANYARSSAPRSSKDPNLGPGGVAFVSLASDAVTYATVKGSYAPNNLTLKQLQEIFGCNIKAANGDPAGTWGALLGSKAAKGSAKQKIDPVVPQAGAGTLSFWMETALGFSSDSQPTCSSEYENSIKDPTAVPEENEGIDKAFLVNGKPNKNIVWIYSIGSWIAQAYHDPACGTKPAKGQDEFGCDENGVMFLNGIAGTGPTVKTSSGLITINPKFDPTFDRTLYDVVPFNTKKQPVSALLDRFFGPKGWLCGSDQHSIIEDYGFLPLSSCGAVS